MKLVAGSILTVTSAIFYLARIQAQPINYQEAIQFASGCSVAFFLAGAFLIAWGMREEILNRRGRGAQMNRALE